MNKFVANQRLCMLHSDRGGQSIIFVALILFTLVTFMALVINVGHRTAQKVEVQVGTDAAALSGGTWIARGLNTIAILNVSMTEILAWIIFLQAFKKTNDVAKVAYPLNQAAAAVLCGIPFTAPVGCPWQTYLQFIQPYMNFLNSAAGQIPTIVKALWKFMKALRTAEDVVNITAGVMSEVSAIAVADLNISNLDGAFMVPVGSMPTKEGTFKDICDRTHNGGPGYDNFFRGIAPIDMVFPAPPLRVKEWFALVWAPTSVMLPPPLAMQYLFFELESNALCPGEGSESGNIEMFTSSCNECDTEGYRYDGDSDVKITVPGKSTWQGGVFEVTDDAGLTQKNAPFEVGNIIDIETKNYYPDTTYKDSTFNNVNGRDFGESTLTGGTPSFKGSGTVAIDSALYPHWWCRSYSGGTCSAYSVPDTDTARGPDRTTDIISNTGAMTKVDLPANSVCEADQVYTTQRTYYHWVRADRIAEYDTSNPPVEIGHHYDQIWVRRTAYSYFKERWTLTKCEYQQEQRSEPQDTSTRPKPLILSDNWEDETNYLALAFKDVEDELTVGSSTSGENPISNLALAQVKISNATGEDDLFNQDWHARLTPVNLSKVSLDIFGLSIPIPDSVKNIIAAGTGELVVH